MVLFQNVRIRERYCDFLIEPEKTSDYSTFDFKHARFLYELGEDKTLFDMEKIKKAISDSTDMRLDKKSLLDVLLMDKISEKRTF